MAMGKDGHRRLGARGDTGPVARRQHRHWVGPCRLRPLHRSHCRLVAGPSRRREPVLRIASITSYPNPREEPMTTNADLHRRRLEAIPRGIGTSFPIYVDRARNAEIWDVEGRRYVDFAGGIAVVN